MHIIDELKARGFIKDLTDEGGLAEFEVFDIATGSRLLEEPAIGNPLLVDGDRAVMYQVVGLSGALLRVRRLSDGAMVAQTPMQKCYQVLALSPDERVLYGVNASDVTRMDLTWR